jgi:hypothetical protein
MKNNRKCLITGVLCFFIIMAVIFYFLYFNRGGKSVLLPTPTEPSPPPITTVYMDSSVVHFNCLNTSSCFSDIDLSDQIKKITYPDNYPLYLESAFYGHDARIYLTLGGSIWFYLVRVDPQTSKIQLLNLNVPSLSSRPDILPIMPMFLPGGVKMIHNKLVVATADGKIGIVQDNFSLKTIDLGSSIRDFIEANNSTLVALSSDSHFHNGKVQLKVFVVDINLGRVREKILNGPQEGDVFTLSPDLNNVYSTTSDDTLHLFDVQTQKELVSTPISHEDYFTYSTLMFSRAEYRGAWYISRPGISFEGPAPAILVDMATLKPIINPSELLKDELNTEFIITPFGDHFLIGTNSRVLVISLTGAIEKTYFLPKEWIGRGYILLEYRK